MVNYVYSYLIMNLLFLIVWLALFFYRKDTRKEMLTSSIIVGLVGLIAEFVYTFDWWHPLTITGTRLGFEDFLLGFLVGGIGSVIYTIIFKKRLSRIKNKKRNIKKIIWPILIGLTIFLGGFFILRINTFWLTILSLLVVTLIILSKRKDLIANSILSGVLFAIVGFLIYFALNLITPGWIEEFLYFQNIPKMVLLKTIPFEDLLWFFLGGCMLGPLYEYWQEAKLVNKK
jgi:hypothetical protein